MPSRRAVADEGYQVDCSVCPHVSWAGMKGDPAGPGGPDFRRFPDHPYRLDLDRIDRRGDSHLLEVPMSVLRSRLHRIAPWAYVTPLLRRFAWSRGPDRLWLYPDGRNDGVVQAVLDEALASGRPYVEMVLHSSELMPGGSPSTPDEASAERLFAQLEALFSRAQASFQGMTLTEFRHAWVAGAFAAAASAPSRTSRPRPAPVGSVARGKAP